MLESAQDKKQRVKLTDIIARPLSTIETNKRFTLTNYVAF